MSRSYVIYFMCNETEHSDSVMMMMVCHRSLSIKRFIIMHDERGGVVVTYTYVYAAHSRWRINVTSIHPKNHKPSTNLFLFHKCVRAGVHCVHICVTLT